MPSYVNKMRQTSEPRRFLQANGAELSATVLLIVIAACLFGWRSFNMRSIPGSYRLDVPGYKWDASQSTLAVVVRYGCAYCHASLPFYEHLLSDSARRHPSQTRIIFVTADDEYHTMRAVPASARRDSIYSNVVLPGWVEGTPTVCLLDRDGRVLKIWFGQLNNSQEQEVFDAIARL